jgi:hypothetical protein
MRKVFRFLFGNWFARGYLLLVAIFAVLSFAAGRFAGEDTSFAAGFFLLLVTVPWSLLMPSPVDLPSGWLGEVIFFGGLAVSALLNAAVISLVVHAVRGRIRDRA